MNFNADTFAMLGQGTLETIYIIGVSALLSYLIGLPLGVILIVTDPAGIHPCRIFNKILGTIINIMRSIPFIIFLIAVQPFTRFVTGTTVGSTATLVPLVLSAAPYVARMIESSLKEVDAGVIEAAKSMGASTWQIIYKVLVPEAVPSVLLGAAISITTLIGYSAMTGFTGGGGLGNIAINYGYYRYDTPVMLATVFLLIVIVQILQGAGNKLSKHFDRRIK